MAVQAAQVRKVSFIPPADAQSKPYDPDTHPSCTVYAGTHVQQVRQCCHPLAPGHAVLLPLTKPTEHR